MGAIETVKDILKDSIRAKDRFLSDEVNCGQVAAAAGAIVGCYGRGGKVIVFGNGGSAADSQHFAAELIVRFEKERKGLPCLALTTNTSTLTATSNDYDFNKIFSRQVEALAGPLDVVVAISTSGNSENVLEGARAARAKKIPVIALSGRGGGKLLAEADIPIVVNAENTARIQEVHITIIHIICKIVEEAFAV